jgi:hypothetical protein
VLFVAVVLHALHAELLTPQKAMSNNAVEGRSLCDSDARDGSPCFE